MTAREMQIEFERRITLIDPNLRDAEKITSDSIFAFLNAAQERIISQIYTQSDSDNKTRATNRIIDALKTLTSVEKLNVTVDNNYTYKADIPSDYMFYISSVSTVTDNYKQAEGVVPNKVIDYDSMQSIIPSYFDNKIIRTPYVVLNIDDANKIYIIHDKYTIISSIDLQYYRKPSKISLNNECELPDTMHLSIV
ncbi:phage adaptor protein, partial [Intestinibacter sp.]|uniref:phage adaptor protein n=1 Tax=Intestinibacter sp. TaxID=1965304 RepID=UPI003F18ADB6